MDQMLPSPSFSNIDIGTPHHPMEDEQVTIKPLIFYKQSINLGGF